ncbi:TlpA disulfide reductase family protein [Pararhodonellum marinum]|uniref:TlpA disulfide reductase family protein n=1 Tax=Pararhodonellum marinum TaxID=2755358 RepID=UPI001E2FAAAD|nr:TlpA disulfide reductase family protein [Pararhodonellum marinum]
MKKLLNFSLIILILSYSCAQKSEPQDPTIIISGKITNLDEQEITLFQEGDIANSKVDEDGNFKLVFEGDEPSSYSLYSGRTYLNLYLSPGDSIYVSADAKDLSGTFEVNGDHEKEIRYLFEKAKTETEIGLTYPMELMEKPKEEYLQIKDSLFTRSRVKFVEYSKQENLDPDFVAKEEAYFTYAPLVYDYQYPMYQASITKKPQDSIDFPMDQVNAKLNAIPLDQNHLLNVWSYTTLIDIRVSNLAGEILERDSSFASGENAYEKAGMLAMDSLLKDKTVKDHFYFTAIKSNLDYRGPVHVKASYEKFMKENETPKYAEKLNKLKAKWEPISPGKDVPDFTFTNVEGEEVKLSDLKGNLVYIDIWATWCKPCIAEHPYWDKLKEEFKDEPVAFLTVSIDDTRAPWEKMVKAKNMEGLQWFAENGWKSELNQHFMVNSIPRFILLDQAGKIIDPSADRPSGNIRAILDQHLAEKGA